MKVAVIGSREFSNASLLSERLSEIEGVTEIISGGARGADQLAEAYARQHGIATKIFLPDYDRYGRGAPLKRNQQIIERADLVVAFWDGKSRGTMDAIKKAKALRKEIQINYFVQLNEAALRHQEMRH